MKTDQNSNMQGTLNKRISMKKRRNAKRALLALNLVAVIFTTTVFSNPVSVLSEEVSTDTVQSIENSPGTDAQIAEQADVQQNTAEAAQAVEAPAAEAPAAENSAEAAKAEEPSGVNAPAENAMSAEMNAAEDGVVSTDDGASSASAVQSADTSSASNGSFEDAGAGNTDGTKDGIIENDAEGLNEAEGTAANEESEDAASQEQLTYEDEHVKISVSYTDGRAFTADSILTRTYLDSDEKNAVLSAVNAQISKGNSADTVSDTAENTESSGSAPVASTTATTVEYSVAGFHALMLAAKNQDGSDTTTEGDVTFSAEFKKGLNDAGYASREETTENNEAGGDGSLTTTTTRCETSWKIYTVTEKNLTDITDITDAHNTHYEMDENGTLKSASFRGALPQTVAFVQIVKKTVTETTTQKETEKATEKETQKVTEKYTEKITGKAAEKTTETETEKEDVKAEVPASAAMPAVAFDQKVTTENGTVMVHIDAEEGAFEEGTSMTVTPVTRHDILDKAIDAAGGKGAAAAMDITFTKADGTKTEPLKPIHVKMISPVLNHAEEAHVVHVADSGTIDVVARKSDGKTIESTSSEAASSDAKNAVSFESDSFSVYAIVYTVDFEYSVNGKMYQFSIPGGEKIALSDLIEVLGIIDDTNNGEKAVFNSVDSFLKEVANVEFSDESLVRVTKNLFGNDWTLKSLEPFTSDETLTITMKNGEKIVVRVTDAEYSTDLSRFVDSVNITGAEQVSGNTWTVKPDQEYTIDLHFKETNGVLQFDNAGPLTYKLPAISSYVPETGSIAIVLRDAKGNRYTIEGNRYTIDKNGNLKFYWNTSDPNFNKLAASGNTEFTLKIKGKFSEYDDNKQINFGNNIVKELDVKEPVVGVTPTKTGYIGQDGKAHYTVTVTSTGNSQNVHLEDFISGSKLTLDRNSFSIRSNKGTYDSSVIHTNGNRFYADFSSLQDGEVITIDYTASIDYAGLAADGKVEASETSNEFKVKTGDNPEIKVPHNFENNISYSSFNKSGKVSETENPDRTKTITWTIDANNEKRLSLAGSQIKDSIVGWTSDSIMNYSGAGITILVDKGNGQTETRTATWSEVGLSNGRWAYNVPTTDGNYSYHITYTTDVNVSGLLTDTTVTNHAEDKYDDKDTSVDIGPDDENKLSVEKSVQHIDLQKNQVEWKIDVNVPKNGFTSLVVEDIFPHNDTLQDRYVDKSLDVKGLVEGEDYDKGFSDPTKVRLTFKYTDSDGNVQYGVKGTGESRTITITLKTENDPGWKAAYDAGQTNIFNDHKNLAKVWGNNVLVEDDAIANLNEPEVKKSVYNGARKTDTNTGLPMYCFKVHISQVTTDKIVIDDYFDTSVFEHTRFLHGGGNADEFSDKLHGDRDGNSDTTGEGTAATVEEIPGGLRFTIDNVPKQDDNSYYPYYNLYYYLRLKDDTTAAMLDQLAKENGGKYDVTNTAVFGDASGDATVTFEHSTMSKVGDKTSVEEGDSVHFTLTINPEKLRLNGGANLELKDEIKNLSIDYHSIRISADPVGRENDITYDMSGMIMTYQIPDETKVTIEYDATAISKGEFSNKATFNGQERTAGGNVTQSTQGGGTSGAYSIYLYKYEEGNLSKGLDGAVFDLYGPYTAEQVSANNNKVPDSDMKGQPGSKFLKSFTTGEPLPGEQASADDAGKVIIFGDDDKDHFALDDQHYYFLLETQAPEGFEKSDVHYRFKIGDQANYNQYIYYNHDTLKVRNHSSSNRLIINKTISGYTGLMTEDQLNATKASISFEVSGSFHIKDTDEDIDETITIPYSDFTRGQYILTEFVKDGKTLEVKKDTSYVVKETLTDVDGFIHSTTYKINGGSPQDYQDVGASVPVTADSGSNEGTGRISFENFYQEEKAKIKIKKVWPEGEPDAATFKGLDVVIKKDGEEYKTVTLTKEEGWEKVVENLELPGHYTVEENAIPGFTQQSIKYEVTYLDQTKEEKSFLDSSGEVTLTNVPRVPDEKTTNLMVRKNWEGKEGGPELTEAEREKLTATVELVRYRELDSGVTVHFYEWSNSPYPNGRPGQVQIHDDIKIAKSGEANITITRIGSTPFNQIFVVPDETYPNVSQNYQATYESNYIKKQEGISQNSSTTLTFDSRAYSQVYVFFLYSNFKNGDISVSTTTPAVSDDKEIDPEYDNPATVTLNSHNSWVSEFQNLPKSGKGLDGQSYVYSYGIREVSASNGFEVVSFDTGFSEDDLADGASNPSSTGSITVTNKKTKDTAPLKIKKTFEGVPEGTDVSGLQFEIAGPNDFSKTRIISYADFDENGEYLIGEDLIVGDIYRVSELNADTLVEDKELIVSGSTTTATGVVALGDNPTTINLVNKYGGGGDITVTKTVKHNGKNVTDNTDTFYVGLFTRTGEEGNYTYTRVDGTENKAVTTTTPATFDNLEFGTYYVFEMNGNTDKRVEDTYGVYTVINSGTECTLNSANTTASAKIINDKKDGAIVITKKVKFNGNDTTTALADGAYVFSIAGPDSQTVVKYVQITVTGGKAVSYKVADGPTEPADWSTVTVAETFDDNAENRGAVVPDLVPGDYTITETEVSGMTTTVSGGKDSVSNAVTNSITVTVTAGETVDAKAQATFTNDKTPMKSFNFNKIWLNSTGSVETSDTYQSWQENITVTIGRRAGNVEDNQFALKYTISKAGGTFTATMDTSASRIPEDEGNLDELTLAGSGSNVFNFKMPDNSLRKYNDEGTEWEYYVVETQIDNYAPTKYGAATTGDSGTTYSIINGASDAKDGGVIVNQTFAGYELPSTGGPGTLLYSMLGMMLIAFAGTAYMILLRRRRASLKGSDNPR